MGQSFRDCRAKQSGQHSESDSEDQPLNSKMRSFVLISVGLLAMTSAKFCPGEKNGNKCVAGKDSYKCAVFFEDLTSSRPLTWIGALPDALKKARNKAEIAEILGKDVTEESFKDLENWATTCVDRSGGGSGTATVSRLKVSVTSDCPSTTAPATMSGPPCLMEPVASMWTSPSAATLTGLFSDVTAQITEKLAENYI